MKDWFCCDCETTVDLNRSGRCECCGSEAVDIASREKPLDRGLRELEKMWLACRDMEKALDFPVE